MTLAANHFCGEIRPGKREVVGGQGAFPIGGRRVLGAGCEGGQDEQAGKACCQLLCFSVHGYIFLSFQYVSILRFFSMFVYVFRGLLLPVNAFLC